MASTRSSPTTDLTRHWPRASISPSPKRSSCSLIERNRTMSHAEPRLGIYYEHPDWYRPLFAELDRRGVPYDALHADTHSYDPSEREPRHAVVFNRMSPSAYIRGRGD